MRQNKWFSLLSAVTLIFLFCSFCRPLRAATTYWKHPGVVFRAWDQENADFAQICPECGPMGGLVYFSWNDLNPGHDSFNFSAIEEYLNRAKQIKTAPFPDGSRIPKPVVVAINILLGSGGDLTPSWVPGESKIVNCNGQDFPVPPYNDSRWREAYYSFVKALGAHFEAKKSQFPNLAGFNLCNGYDCEAYPTIFSCNNQEASTGYHLFIAGMAKAIGESFKTIPVYVPAGGGGFTAAVVEGAKAHNYGVKSNTIHDGAGEANNFSWYGEGLEARAILGNPAYATLTLPWSAAMVTNEQVSWSFEDARSFNYAHGINAYSQMMMMMALGGDWMDFRDINAFKTLGQAYPYFLKVFVPRYFGQPKSRTPGAWIAFRDIRDSTVYKDKWVRGREIICWGKTACHSHFFGDYTFYLKRVADSGAAKMYANQFPPPAQEQPYGFARSLEPGGYLSLGLENGVWFKGRDLDLGLRVVILNQGTGRVEVEYRKKDGGLAKEVISKGSGLGGENRFVEVTRTLEDVRLNGSLMEGGDFVIKAHGDRAVIHLFEINTDAPPPAQSAASDRHSFSSSSSSPSPTLPPSSQSTSQLTMSAKARAVLLEIKQELEPGWNELVWQSRWPEGLSFGDLSLACPYVTYQEGSLFKTYVKDYAQDKPFVSGQKYLIYCLTDAAWFE